MLKMVTQRWMGGRATGTECQRTGAPRVLLLASQPFFEWRGSPIRIGFDVQALAECGFDVDLLVLPVGADREIPGVRLLRVPNVWRVRRMPIGPSLVKAAFDGVLFFHAWRLARRRRYDVVHGVEDAGAVALAVARLTGSRAVFERHSDPTSYRRGMLRNAVMALYGAVERWTARGADAVIGTGPGLAEQMRRAVPGKPIHDIPDIASSLVEATADGAAAARRRLDPAGGSVLATFIGSFASYQGVDLLMESIPAALAARAELRFVIIGGTADQIAARRARLAARGAEARVAFPGTIPPEEVPDVLRASDILLSPRLTGVNTPLKLLDYLKAGRAIVATDVPANRLILDAEVACLAAPEPQALAAAVAALAAEPARREDLGRRGRALFERRYTFGEFKRRLRECYEAVLGCGANGATARGSPCQFGGQRP